MSWLWLIIPAGLLVGGGVLFLTIRSGVIWDGIVKAATRGAKALFFAMLPGFLKIFKPASPEELAKQDEGPGRSATDRFNKGSGRPFGRGKE
jgi:hypothetical protein